MCSTNIKSVFRMVSLNPVQHLDDHIGMARPGFAKTAKPFPFASGRRLFASSDLSPAVHAGTLRSSRASRHLAVNGVAPRAHLPCRNRIAQPPILPNGIWHNSTFSSPAVHVVFLKAYIDAYGLRLLPLREIVHDHRDALGNKLLPMIGSTASHLPPARPQPIRGICTDAFVSSAFLATLARHVRNAS